MTHRRSPNNPAFHVRIRRITPPVGSYQHAVSVCPRCGGHLGVNAGMLAGVESIICKGELSNGAVCNGHYYLDLNAVHQLEFVGVA